MAQRDEAAGGSAAETLLRRRGKCPICGKTSDRAFHPFCSRRCAAIDLSRWFSGSYAIPGSPLEEEGAERPSPPDEDDGKD